MAGTPFEGRWELTDTQREQVRTIKDAFASLAKMKAGVAAIEASLHAQAQAIALEVLTSIPGAPSKYQVPIRAMAADLATVERVSDATVRNRMDDAALMIQHFPATFTALAHAEISAAHASTICDEGGRLADDGIRERYEQIALQFTDTTPAKLRPICQAIAERLEPRTLAERHEEANARRGLWVTPDSDGMADVILRVDAALAAGIGDRTREMARAVQAAASPKEEDARTLSQIQADVVADLLLTGAPTAHGDGLDGIRATVQVTVPAEVITGDDRTPAHISGVGVVAPATARRLAGRTHTWARLLLDPKTGVPIAVDSYVPSAEQRRLLIARDETCRFPGCRRSVRRCDIDHTKPYSEGGATDVDNLGALCRAHHVVKHHSGWRARNLGRGVFEWVTPTGEILHEKPPPSVRFVALAVTDADPPPF
ncbi:DUF222 domain-containing protein [Microbacterium sp.]|uniref:HNH endonuclease signature motif containing protein n=1 Tax=Microbacterium sp. TaxID=51671 RepID=UPI002811141E|nr:DUF222 domain-containing protein [Microbacterium sp.]